MAICSRNVLRGVLRSRCRRAPQKIASSALRCAMCRHHCATRSKLRCASLPAALGEQFFWASLGRPARADAPEAIRGVVDDPYKLQGSRGRGNWAETVWVSVFDRLVTETAQRGYYIVYLLRGDGDGVYLSLDQGATAVHQEVGGRRYLGVLEDRATVYAGLLSGEGIDGLIREPIDLGGSGTPTRGYEAGSIVARYYKANAIPAEAELHEDLLRYGRRIGRGEPGHRCEASPLASARRAQPQAHQGRQAHPGLVVCRVRIQLRRPLRRCWRGLYRSAPPHSLRRTRRTADEARPKARLCSGLRELPSDAPSQPAALLAGGD